MLRWDKENLIPLCKGCHLAHHQKGDYRINEAIIEKKGREWLEYIEYERQIIFKDNLTNLREIELTLND